jgi:hypothetical protein
MESPAYVYFQRFRFHHVVFLTLVKHSSSLYSSQNDEMQMCSRVVEGQNKGGGGVTVRDCGTATGRHLKLSRPSKLKNSTQPL